MNQQARADWYQFLSLGFLREPSADFLAQYKQVLHKLLKCCSPISGLYDSLVKLDECTVTAQDYYDMFFVPQSGAYVPLFESAVVNGQLTKTGFQFGLLQDRQGAEVNKIYQLFRFNPHELQIYSPLKFNPFSDHLGFELAFMSFLAYQEQLLDDGANLELRKWQSYFIKEHLGPFSSQLQTALTGKPPFYEALIQLVEQFMKVERGRFYE